jgi:hypothetical protein
MAAITALTTAWAITAAITGAQATIAPARRMQASATTPIAPTVPTAPTALITIVARTIAVSGTGAGTLTVSARAGAGRTPTANSSGSATEPCRSCLKANKGRDAKRRGPCCI